MKKSDVTQFALYLRNTGLTPSIRAFKQQAASWLPVKIKGESRWLLRPGASIWPTVFQELDATLNQTSKLERAQVHVLYERAAVNLLAGIESALSHMQCEHWQVLRAEPLIQRAGSLSPGDLDDEKVWQERLLPLLAQAFFYDDAALSAERIQRQKQHTLDADDLRAAIDQLKREKADLAAQLGAMRQIDIDTLLSFLPALYRSFWSGISPVDLALLAGRMDAPTIASPYREPSAETIHAKRKQFLRLPQLQRNSILTFCQQLPEALEVRHEMRDLFQDNRT